MEHSFLLTFDALPLRSLTPFTPLLELFFLAAVSKADHFRLVGFRVYASLDFFLNESGLSFVRLAVLPLDHIIIVNISQFFEAFLLSTKQRVNSRLAALD